MNETTTTDPTRTPIDQVAGIPTHVAAALVAAGYATPGELSRAGFKRAGGRRMIDAQKLRDAVAWIVANTSGVPFEVAFRVAVAIRKHINGE